MKRHWPLGLLMLLLTAAPAHGEGYLGMSLGHSSIGNDELQTSSNRRDYKLYAGARFLKFAGIEGGYVDFAEPGEQLFLPLEQMNGLDFFGVGVLPLGQHFELFGKAGLVYWQADVLGSTGENGIDLAYGVGAAVKLGKFFAFRVEYEQFQIDRRQQLSLASVGFDVRF